jgi:D-glycero-beta-D-manno-heptose 1-phosphate adenylyltransferase
MLINPQLKIKSLEELKIIASEFRRNGRTIVFANGCFDVLHVGHVRYLKNARALGDMLILGVNGDDSIRALKGSGRPLLNESERMEILASFECVDYVLHFNDRTVDAILNELKPDFHAKGTDYSVENVPERGTVLSYGGQIAITGDPKDHSTRDLIQTIVDRFDS